MTASWWVTVPRESWRDVLEQKADELRKLTHDSRCYTTAPIKKVVRKPVAKAEEDL